MGGADKNPGNSAGIEWNADRTDEADEGESIGIQIYPIPVNFVDRDRINLRQQPNLSDRMLMTAQRSLTSVERAGAAHRPHGRHWHSGLNRPG